MYDPKMDVEYNADEDVLDDTTRSRTGTDGAGYSLSRHTGVITWDGIPAGGTEQEDTV